MKKLVCFVLLIPFVFSGCNTKTTEVNKSENNVEHMMSESEEKTYIITGIIIKKYHIYHTDLVIETDSGIKIPVYEGRYSHFSDGLEEGDRVSFKIKEVEGSGFEVVGLNF